MKYVQLLFVTSAWVYKSRTGRSNDALNASIDFAINYNGELFQLHFPAELRWWLVCDLPPFPCDKESTEMWSGCLLLPMLSWLLVSQLSHQTKESILSHMQQNHFLNSVTIDSPENAKYDQVDPTNPPYVAGWNNQWIFQFALHFVYIFSWLFVSQSVEEHNHREQNMNFKSRLIYLLWPRSRWKRINEFRITHKKYNSRFSFLISPSARFCILLRFYFSKKRAKGKKWQNLSSTLFYWSSLKQKQQHRVSLLLLAI